MSTKVRQFIGITLVIFWCCYIYQAVYPHIAGAVLVSFYSDVKLIISGQVSNGYGLTPEQSARMSQFKNLTYVIKALLASVFSVFGAMGIIQFLKRFKKN